MTNPIETDPLYNAAVQAVQQTGRTEISFLQRRLKIGYNRAANLLATLKENGVTARDEQGDQEIQIGTNTSLSFDLIEHLYRQRSFSEKTFGPGTRTDGVLDHIAKESAEVRAKPLDLEEWVDLILLSLDGAWRAGHEPEAIAAAIEAKQAKNESRAWPDWRTADTGKAIEHIKATANNQEEHF